MQLNLMMYSNDSNSFDYCDLDLNEMLFQHLASNYLKIDNQGELFFLLVSDNLAFKNILMCNSKLVEI